MQTSLLTRGVPGYMWDRVGVGFITFLMITPVDDLIGDQARIKLAPPLATFLYTPVSEAALLGGRNV